jgi:glutamate-1-semialdehyde 2,1-aminomutase
MGADAVVRSSAANQGGEMKTADAETAAQETHHQYERLTARSRRLYERARTKIPGGATRSLNSWPPYPIYLKSASGATVIDVDNRRYLDFLNNYTALALGHAPPLVVTAVQEAAAKGTSLSFSSPLETELAERLIERVPSLRKVRFTGSGTEAVMFVLRVARAATRRPQIAKVEGGYHGTIDEVMVSVRPNLLEAGPPDCPVPLPEMSGLVPGVADRTVVLPFNNIVGSDRLLTEHGDQLAAVVVEPMLGVGGMIPATAAYLQWLRRRCTELDIVLVFDEVITLRLSVGGAQQRYGIEPDLTVIGKTIGGGLPIGAYGGRADLMELLEARGGTDVYNARSGGPPLYQGGTFTGNPCSLAAGIATLSKLDDDTLGDLNKRGDLLRERINAQAGEQGLPLRVTGMGSLFNLHITDRPVVDFRDTWQVDGRLQHALFLELLNTGFIVAPRGMGCLSTAMTSEHEEAFAEAVLAIVSRLRTAGE